MANDRPLYNAVLEVRGVLDHLMVSGHQNADNLLKRCVHLIAPDTALGALSAQLLPAMQLELLREVPRDAQGVPGSACSR